jgi:hypothetical protein
MRFTKIVISLLGALLLIGVSATLSAAQEGQGWQDAPWQFSAKVYGLLPKAPVEIKIDQDEVANLPESLSLLPSTPVISLQSSVLVARQRRPTYGNRKTHQDADHARTGHLQNPCSRAPG